MYIPWTASRCSFERKGEKIVQCESWYELHQLAFALTLHIETLFSGCRASLLACWDVSTLMHMRSRSDWYMLSNVVCKPLHYFLESLQYSEEWMVG